MVAKLAMQYVLKCIASQADKSFQVFFYQSQAAHQDGQHDRMEGGEKLMAGRASRAARRDWQRAEKRVKSRDLPRELYFSEKSH